jgi:hypothetical protein
MTSKLGGRLAARKPALPAALRDPGVRAAVILAGFVIAGFVVILLAWVGTSEKGYVALQLPWVVSGAMVGLALIGVGAALLDIHLWRRQAATRRTVLSEVVRDTSELAESIAARVARRRAAAKPAKQTAARRPANRTATKPAAKRTAARKTAAKPTARKTAAKTAAKKTAARSRS